MSASTRRAPSDQIFIDSYDNDFDPVYQTRFYKHYQDGSRCQQAEMMPDYQRSYWQLHHCLIACPDCLSGYNPRDPSLAEYLINAGKTWSDHGVDDFRLDVIKFPFPQFVAPFTHAMIQYLHFLGRPSPLYRGRVVAPGSYPGLLTQASTANQGNSLTLFPEGQATVYLGRLSALVVWSQPPQP